MDSGCKEWVFPCCDVAKSPLGKVPGDSGVRLWSSAGRLDICGCSSYWTSYMVILDGVGVNHRLLCNNLYMKIITVLFEC